MDDLTPSGETSRIPGGDYLGEPVELIVYSGPSGMVLRWAHACDQSYKQDGDLVRWAPRLPVHGFDVDGAGLLTVTPNVECADCGLIGSITDGEFTIVSVDGGLRTAGPEFT